MPGRSNDPSVRPGADNFPTNRWCAIWIAVSAYVLVALVKKRLQQQASLHTLLRIPSVTPFEKTPIQQAFSRISCQIDSIANVNQLNLFEF
jgi:hypothetical protein